MGALIDTGATMTPSELAEHGVDVPQAVSSRSTAWTCRRP